MIKLGGSSVLCEECGAVFATGEYYNAHKTAASQCIKPEAVGLVLQSIGSDGDFHYVKPLAVKPEPKGQGHMRQRVRREK